MFKQIGKVKISQFYMTRGVKKIFKQIFMSGAVLCCDSILSVSAKCDQQIFNGLRDLRANGAQHTSNAISPIDLWPKGLKLGLSF